MKLEIDGIIYDVIIERKHIKNTYLRVKEDLNIYVTTSYLMPNYLIKKFVKENVDFIRKQINKQEKNENSFNMAEWINVNSFNYTERININSFNAAEWINVLGFETQVSSLL